MEKYNAQKSISKKGIRFFNSTHNSTRLRFFTVCMSLVVVVEFIPAYTLEMTMGSPCSFKSACRVFAPRTSHPMHFESAIICATVGLMYPAMRFLAAIMYYPYYTGFNLLTMLANWIKRMCFNFPFAFFTQLFFIQPCVRIIFRFLFKKDIATRKAEAIHN